ncbi:hypothetical protein CHU98_g11347 [Xylaria longipes]|nr:hypothetical protein CHU98_g11347 [Xylaria longipes]
MHVIDGRGERRNQDDDDDDDDDNNDNNDDNETNLTYLMARDRGSVVREQLMLEANNGALRSRARCDAIRCDAMRRDAVRAIQGFTYRDLKLNDMVN